MKFLLMFFSAVAILAAVPALAQSTSATPVAAADRAADGKIFCDLTLCVEYLERKALERKAQTSPTEMRRPREVQHTNTPEISSMNVIIAIVFIVVVLVGFICLLCGAAFSSPTRKDIGR
jgi:hypothetical protein